MSEHPIQGLMQTAMENIKEMIDVNTIIGDPVETPDGSVILTVSKVGFGFAAGGSQFNSASSGHSKGSSDEDSLPFGGGSGGGVSITPIAFLIVNSSGVKTIHLDNSTHLYERLLDLAPQVVEKIQKMMNNTQGSKSNNQQRQQQPDLQQTQHQSERRQKHDLDF
ncbi:GerW family sporulation protein [Pseudalkalibacillus berkeleyi]|uniref:GerW family sporulation protein n=1 Tax=Pseudalkalibacillus berkeleyi TaxID=1069813 RepID=A0ABS9GZP9_9BACL|nr:GerW family sporulation protein [Pseudalkalibacillus berkeleyi]MCF6138227.1 GerW family sporulation protein [Pseudalkalibacillus berkeleyi]